MERENASFLLGRQMEERATNYLCSKGVDILERNFHSPFGEIDIVGRTAEYILFVEVRYRKNSRFGYPQETVARHKQIKIRRTALFYIARHQWEWKGSYRFDVIAICGEELEWIQNAFII